MSTRLTRAESRAATRQALLDAAAGVFAERGFAGASVEAIVAEAGYTRGAFYSNFQTKEELFAELLQQRAYALYGQMARASADGERVSLRVTGERLAAVQASESGGWLFRLWLELLAHAGRDDGFREIAAGFWRSTRDLSAAAIAAAYEETGARPPTNPDWIASAMIALDIGLALQHFVDPERVPLDAYPELYELLFRPFAPSSVPDAG